MSHSVFWFLSYVFFWNGKNNVHQHDYILENASTSYISNMHFYALSESPAFSEFSTSTFPSNFTAVTPPKRGLKRIAQIIFTCPMWSCWIFKCLGWQAGTGHDAIWEKMNPQGMWKNCLWNVDHFSERDEWCLSIYCTFAIITIYHSILYSDIFILIYYVVHIVMWIDILLWFYETVDMQYESPQCEFPPHHSKPFLPTLWGYDVCRKIRQHYEESRTVAWRISSKDIGPSIQSLSPEPIPKDRNNCF